MQQIINEEMNIQKGWYENAENMTMDNLPEFLRHLSEDYRHDYGTICHALSAGSLATIHAMNRAPGACGGITGFQAGCVMWEFIRNFNYKNNKCGLRLQDMDKLLFPQYADMFLTISGDTWNSVQKEAAKKIQQDIENHKVYLDRMEQYKKDLKQFKADVKQFESEHPEYPKYEEDPEFYQHLRCGTAAEWDVEHKKEESGFMFEPIKPYDDVAHPDVVAHWKSIVAGNIPFGLRVEEKP